MMQQVVDLGGAQQRLCRDAAPVEADAAELLTLDDCGLHAELRRPDRGDIAARPTAQHHDVEGSLRHARYSVVSIVGRVKRSATRHSFRARRGGLPPAFAGFTRPTAIAQDRHSSMVSGSSISFLKAARNCAPTAPSTTR